MSQRRIYPITASDRQKIAEVQSYIVNNLHLHFSIASLSKKAGMNREKFQQGFRDVYNDTVASYIHQSRMRLARFLLLHTEKTFKEIASSIGYAQVQNFYTAYKRFFGHTPGAEKRES